MKNVRNIGLHGVREVKNKHRDRKETGQIKCSRTGCHSIKIFVTLHRIFSKTCHKIFVCNQNCGFFSEFLEVPTC